MNSGLFKRLVAYILDIIIVSMILNFAFFIVPSNDKMIEARNNLDNLTASFGKVDSKEFLELYQDYNYEYSSSSSLHSIVSITVYILYFIVFQYMNKGATIGKQILKIRVVKDNEEELQINDFIIRAFIINFLLFDLIEVFLILTVSKGIYQNIIFMLSLIQIILVIVSSFMVIYRKDKRSLHDILTNTRVLNEVN